MSKGTSGEYWTQKSTQSAFKHELLRKYAPVFGGTTGSRSDRVFYVDGFAGEGRYGDGTPGSAELVLQIAHNQASKVRWTCLFAEKDNKSAVRLRAVVEEYVSRGVDAEAYATTIDDQLDKHDQGGTPSTGQGRIRKIRVDRPR